MELETGRFCFEAAKFPANGRMLLLAGANGTGKTHCAKAIHNWASKCGHAITWMESERSKRYLDVIFWHWPNLLDMLKKGHWDVIEDMFTVGILIIDELGGGHDPSGVGTDKLCQILSAREKKWTVITTNITPDAWEQTFDKRVTSRFFRNATLIDLSDVPDFNV